MADAVTTQWVYPPNWQGETEPGWRRMIVHLTNISDGAGETAVVKVNKGELRTKQGREPSKLVVEKIVPQISGMAVTLAFDRVPVETIAVLNDASGCMEFDGGLVDPGEGGTGDIILTTTGHSSGDSYDIILHIRLKD